MTEQNRGTSAAYQPVRNPKAEQITEALATDPARMLRALMRLYRHNQRWPWKVRKRYFDLIRHMERRDG